MKKVFLFVACAIIFIGCSKKNEESPQPIDGNSEYAELYEAVSNKLEDYLQNNPTTEIKDVIEYASGLDAVTSCEIRDSILYVITKGQYEYVCDWYGLCHAEPIDETFNSEEFDKLIDSLETVWGYKPWNEGGTLVDEEFETDDYDTNKNGIAASLVTRSGTDVRFLTRKNAVIWCPWPDLQKDTSLFTNILSRFKIKVSFSSNLSAVPSFNLYDLILVYTHGSPQGEIVIPVSSKSVYKKEIEAKIVSGGSVKQKNKIIPCLFLGRNYFRQYLPSDMSHTILWTIACHLGHSNSEFLAVAKEKKIADFFGADNECKLIGPYWRFMDFAPRFCNGFTSAKAFYDGRQYYSDGYFEKGVYYTYNYWRRGNAQVCYVEPLTGKPYQSGSYSCTVQVGIHYPSELNTEIFSTGNVKMGIRLVNKKNNQSWDFPISSGNIYETFNYVNEMSVRSYPVALTGLEPETSYKYYAYSIVNGRRIWAKYSHSFTTGKEDGESLVRKYLVKLYQDTDGDHWFNNTNWCSDKPISEWYGVKYSNGYLELELNNNNLQNSADLSGCASLIRLSCKKNQLISLNVSSCKLLYNLDCSGNQLTNLNLIQCPKLTYLYCESNEITNLDLTGNTSLYAFYCYNNQLKELTGFPVSLCYLNCSINPLTKLTISNSPHLVDLYCYDTQLDKIDVHHYLELKNLKCNGCEELTNINVSGCTALQEFDCSDCKLRNLEISGCSMLEKLYCHNNFPDGGDNMITNLDISDCTALNILVCSNIHLESLNVFGCLSLIYLKCYKNQLSNLNVSSCVKLERLFCNSNQLTNFNVSNCVTLKELDCSDNQLNKLDVSTCISIENLNCSNNQLTDLNVSGCVALDILNCLNNLLCSEIPTWFKQLTHFNCDFRYTNYHYDYLGNFCYTDNGVGWWYPGEPEKGYHDW